MGRSHSHVTCVQVQGQLVGLHFFFLAAVLIMAFSYAGQESLQVLWSAGK